MSRTLVQSINPSRWLDGIRPPSRWAPVLRRFPNARRHSSAPEEGKAASDTAARYTNFPVEPHRTRLTTYTGKLTYTLTKNNKFIAYVERNTKLQPTRLDAFLPGLTAIHDSASSTFNQRFYLSGTWEGPNPVQNTSWSSGSSFLRPLNIIPPWLLRIGAKFEW